MIVEIIGIIAILMAILTVITPKRHSRLLYVNVIGFSISALIALTIKSQFGLILAVTYFITSTISGNALAYTSNLFNDED